MQNDDLLKAYKNTRELIKEDPKNKDAIINEYINLVDIINNYEKSSKSISSSTNKELSKILKNPMEIAIYNNDFKDEIINEFDIPIKHKTLLTTLLLYLLKLFYYQIPLIPKNIDVELKRYVLNEMMVKKESVFLLLKQT